MKNITVLFTVLLLSVHVTMQYKNGITLLREDICSNPEAMRDITL